MAMLTKRKTRIAVALCWEMRGQIEGVVRYAYHAGWSVHVVNPMHSQELRRWRPDGIVCQLHEASHELVDAVKSAAVPTVDLYNFIPSLQAVRVRVDADAAGRLAAEHFLQRRFRRLVHVGRRDWPSDNNYVAGFENCAQAEGADLLNVMIDDPPMVRKYNIWDRHFGRLGERYPKFIDDLAGKLMKDQRLPVGVFSQNALVGVDLVDALLARGARIPEQVAILTLWERPHENELAAVPLSYVQDDYVTQGYRAAETLDQMMQGKPVSPVQWIPPLPVVTLESTDTLAMTHLPTAMAMKQLREHAFDPGFAPKLAAERLGVAIRTMERWFDHHVGMSPANYLEIRRADRAVHLLNHTHLSFIQVAQMSGFSDRRQMNRALWRLHKCSPSDLRSAAQKKTWNKEMRDQTERKIRMKKRRHAQGKPRNRSPA